MTTTNDKALMPAEKIKKVQDLIVMNSEVFKAAMPSSIKKPDRFIRVAMSSVPRTPLLGECTAISILSAIMSASQMGLEIDTPQNQAYLIPYWNSKANRREAQLIIGFRGLIDLAYRTGKIASIWSRVVYKKDQFKLTYGLKEDLVHVPTEEEDKGKKRGAYAVAVLTTGATVFEYMTAKEIEAIKARVKIKGDQSPWVTDEDEMWRKTTYRRLSKVLPSSAESATAIELDNQAAMGEAQTFRTVDISDFKGVTSQILHDEVEKESKTESLKKDLKKKAERTKKEKTEKKESDDDRPICDYCDGVGESRPGVFCTDCDGTGKQPTANDDEKEQPNKVVDELIERAKNLLDECVKKNLVKRDDWQFAVNQAIEKRDTDLLKAQISSFSDYIDNAASEKK